MSVLDTVLAQVQTAKKNESSGDGGWVGSLVAGIIVAVVTAVLGFIAYQRGRELAKLQHERAQAEEDALAARVDAEVAEHVDARDAALDRADEALQRVYDLTTDRKRIEDEHNTARATIDELVSWDDVDAYLRSGTGSAE